jgi:CRAL/TRIO domain
MRHSRFHPGKSPVEDAIDALVYVINTMNEKECNMRNGITLISNFDGWTVDHFSMEYFSRLVAVLQGGVVPVNISSWLIVNAPPSFNETFAVMKRMMTAAFQWRVQLITDSTLAKCMQRGYRNHLPREVAKGRAITKEIVFDFIDARVYIESFQDSTSEKELPRDGVQGSACTKEFLLDFVDARRYIETLQTYVGKGVDFHASQSSTDVTFDCSTSFHEDDLLL